MATRDLTPQDENGKDNKAYVPDEDGAGVRGQTGDEDLDAHTEDNASVTPPKDGADPSSDQPSSSSEGPQDRDEDGKQPSAQ